MLLLGQTRRKPLAISVGLPAAATLLQQVYARSARSKEKHSDYLNYLYSLFEPFVGTEPTSTNRKPEFKLFIQWENICMSHLWISFYGYQYLRDNRIPNAKFYSSRLRHTYAAADKRKQ